MSATRIYSSSEFFQPAEGEPIRSVITEFSDAVVVGEVPLMFVSVVAPADAGYQLAPHPAHSVALPIL